MENEIEFYAVLAGDGDEQVMVYLNFDHIVDIVEDEETGITIHMSDGRTHRVSSESEASFRSFLKLATLNTFSG